MAVSTIVRVTRAYACSAERVYDAWLDAAVACRFFFTVPQHGEVVRCEIDPGIGGRFTVVERRSFNDGEGAVEIEHTGRYLQLDRPRRIAFTFAIAAFSPAETAVIIDILPQGDGCELTLRHDLGPNDDDSAEQIERAEQGWSHMLLNLERALQRQ